MIASGRCCLFFCLANDCLRDYVRDFAKVVSVLHHRVRADLLETSLHWVLDDLTLWPVDLWDAKKTLLLFEFLLPAFGQLFETVRLTSKSSQWQSPRRSCLWPFRPCCEHIFMVLAPLEAVTAPWSVQPNRYVDEEATQVGAKVSALKGNYGIP